MLSEFISQIKQGSLARSNRYIVTFTPPVGSGSLRTISLFCDQIQLPSLNISTVQNRTFGEFRETPYEKLFDNINMSFYVDRDMAVKLLFDDWMAAIQDPITRKFNYYDDYTCDLVIDVQDINDSTTYQVQLYECYPKNIGAVQLDYSSKEIMKLSVVMQYKYWTSGAAATLPDEQVVTDAQIDEFRRDFSGYQQANVIGSVNGTTF